MGGKVTETLSTPRDIWGRLVYEAIAGAWGVDACLISIELLDTRTVAGDLAYLTYEVVREV